MGERLNANEQIRNILGIFTAISERKRPYGKRSRRWEDIIEYKSSICSALRCELDLSLSRKDSVTE